MGFCSGNGSTNASDVLGHFEIRCVSALDKNTEGLFLITHSQQLL